MNKKWIIQGFLYNNKLIFIISVLKSITLGLLSTALLINTQKIIGMVRNRADIFIICINILVFILINVFREFLKSTDEILNLISKNNRDTFFYNKLFNSVVNYEITVFDDPEFLTKLDRAKLAIDSKFEDLYLSMLNLISILTSVTGIVYMISKINVKYLILFILICLIQNFYIIIISKETLNLKLAMDIMNRKDRYYKSLTHEREYVKEIRNYRIIKWLDNLRKTNYWEIYKKHKNFSNKWSLINIFCALILYILEGILYIIIFSQAYTAKLTIEQVVLIIQAHELFSTSLSTLVETLSISRHSVTYIGALEEIVNYDGMSKQIRQLPLDANNIFEIKDVTYYYNDKSKTIFKDLNLNIKKNSVTVILGENGSGKSTLVKLLLGMIEPQMGHIRENAENKSVTFQDFSKFYLTLKENIIISDINKGSIDNQLRKTIHAASIEELISKCPNGLDTMLGKEYDENALDLSGGEWQIIAFARSLYKISGLIILDEPTSALDPIAEEEHLKNVIQTFHGNTVIIITHRIGITKFSDNIIFLKDGEVCETGSHNQLVQKGGDYYGFYNEQSKWYIGG